MTDEPEPGKVHRPGRDKRVSDPMRLLHDRRREAEAMIALWTRSITITAPGEVRYWRGVLADVEATIARLGTDRLPDETEDQDGDECPADR